MKKFSWTTRTAVTIAAGTLVLAGCSGAAEDESTSPAPTQSTSASSAPETGGMAARHHDPEGGPPPEGIETADKPTYPVDTAVVLLADHMPGMEGTEATITGAFDTTTYSVTYSPTDGGEPVVDHKWVVESEIQPDE